MFLVLTLFWLIRTAKQTLFWLYLWQLKEYHFKRFLDHFRTYKGKKLIFQPLQIFKIVLLALLILSVAKGGLDSEFSLVLVLFLIYFGESALAIKALLNKRLKTPVLTKKTGFLILISFLIIFLCPLIVFWVNKSLFLFAICLLVFDVLIPIIVSAIVLVSQPLTVLWQKKLLKKALEKRKQFPNLLVVGIAGSYGKTSTKEFLAVILAEKFRVLKTKEHINAEAGIAKTILNDLKKEHEIFIAEIGAYEKGKIKQVCQMLQPKIGILTGIDEQHMATFGSQENIIKAKYELIESLPKDGIAFFNEKNECCLELYKKTRVKKLLYGKNSAFPGEENILGTIAVAKELGLTDKEISKGLEKIKNKRGGVQLKKGTEGINIIEATYSSNPDGVLAHLDYLKTFSGKKIIIMPCLIELGKASKEVHKRIGKKIAEICDLAIIITRDRFKEIQETVGSKTIFLENPQKIAEKIRDFCKKDDVILLEGRLPKEIISFLI